MGKTATKLVVFFDGTFWVGVFERISENEFSVSKIVFGAEPKDYEVYDFILRNYTKLQFSHGLNNTFKTENTNYKKLQKKIKKQVQEKGLGTKSQIALQKQREETKAKNKIENKKRRDLEEKRKFELKQEKRKQKHKGR